MVKSNLMDVKTLTKRKTSNLQNKNTLHLKVRKNENLEGYTKQNLLKKYKELEEDHQRVLSDNTRLKMENESLSKKLEELLNLKSKNQSSDAKVEAKCNPKATQTTLLDEELIFPCQLCVYNAANEMDLRVHMDYGHDLDDDILLSNLKCKVCKTIFKSKQDLMNHIKTTHEDTLSNCKFYQNNTCKFNEKSCWFVHKKNVLQELKCRYCEHTFNSKSGVMFHQKKNHEDKIPMCKNHIQSKCKYRHKCWFTHPAMEKANHANVIVNEIDMSTNENIEEE